METSGSGVAPIAGGLEVRLRSFLDRRAEEGTLRRLATAPPSLSESSSDAVAPHSGRGGSPTTRRRRPAAAVDLSSNDYLGLARSKSQLARVEDAFDSYVRRECEGVFDRGSVGPNSSGRDEDDVKDVAPTALLGSTGSRLLSGTRPLHLDLEAEVARYHSLPPDRGAMLFNSGYDANLSILSSVPLPGDKVILDELVHNSAVMGVRMGRTREEDVLTFGHNDVEDLGRILSRLTNERSAAQNSSTVFVVVESVYSMDGDVAPIRQILDVAARFDAAVIVDEAHGLGVYGSTNPHDLALPEDNGFARRTRPMHYDGIGKIPAGAGAGVLAALNLQSHPALLATVATYGKAAGCHGASILAPRPLLSYLVNYARPFVYSTSLPPHALLTIRCAYESMAGVEGERRREKVFRLVRLFRRTVLGSNGGGKKKERSAVALLPSPGPIQAVLVPGNARCIEACGQLGGRGFGVYPIRSPTVPKGSERIRVIIHAHNSEEEVEKFAVCLSEVLGGMLGDDAEKIGRGEREKNGELTSTLMSKL